MVDYYLDFENPLKEIDQKIIKLETDASSTAVSYTHLTLPTIYSV